MKDIDGHGICDGVEERSAELAEASPAAARFIRAAAWEEFPLVPSLKIAYLFQFSVFTMDLLVRLYN